MIALFAGLLWVLAVSDAAAAENGAPLFDLPPRPEADFAGHSVNVTYALVGFPDGSAALQGSITPADREKGKETTPERLWFIRIGRDGQARYWIRLPELSVRGATAMLGLADGGVVLMAAGPAYVYLAKVDGDGALLWEQHFESGTYAGGLPPPIALVDGFAILEDYPQSCLLRRLDANGVERWHVEIQNPVRASTPATYSAPVMVAPRPDGGLTVLCDWPNDPAERADGWFSNVDPQGQLRWQRPLRAFAATGLALSDGTLAVFGLVHRIPDNPDDPYLGEEDAQALMRYDAAEGKILRRDWHLFPGETDAPWRPEIAGELVALPDGELLAVTEPRYGGARGRLAARIDRQHRLIWLRPLTGDSEDPDTAQIGGTAVLGSRQVLFAINWYDAAADLASATLRVLPLD
ncbi:MAG: hypothetical protein ACKV2U_34400 [Bryobacteraceae bacterium]